jgi:ABC-2 type transport system permease protein
MKGYISYIKNGFMDNTAHKMHVLVAVLSNVIYMMILYFLWKSIYSGKESIGGMTFSQTMIYMTVVTALAGLFQTYTENYISCRILFGSIIVDMIKPIDFQMQVFCRGLGTMIFNFSVISVPVVVLSIVVFQLHYVIGVNCIFAFIAIINAIVLCSILDFTVGLVSFYTESIWGITVIKEVLVATLAGVYVPLEFYPEKIRNMINILPFRAIYHTPMTLLVNNTYSFSEIIRLLLNQFFWVAVFLVVSRQLFRLAFKNIICNGG